MEPRDKKSNCDELVLPSLPDYSKDLVVHRGPVMCLVNLAEHFREKAFNKWLALVTDLLRKQTVNYLGFLGGWVCFIPGSPIAPADLNLNIEPGMTSNLNPSTSASK